MFNFLMILLFNKCNAELGYSLNSYLYYQKYQVAESSVNPGNQIFKSPSNELDLDLRGEIKWKIENDQIVVRPALINYVKDIHHTSNLSENRNQSKFDLTDAFYEKYLTDELIATVGLQVYQWGPAELINPSNPIFHFNSRQKTFVYREKGQMLIRGNYSFDRQNNLVAIVEPVSNNEAEWIAEAKFEPKALIKYERSWDGTPNYLGLAAGVEEKSTPFVGEYFNFDLREGFSIYGDFKQLEKKINFAPENHGLLTDLAPQTGESDWPSLSIVGLRFEGDFDLRFEYIYNSAGFDSDQLSSAAQAISNPFNPNYVINLERFQNIGLELLGRQYTYLSYRITEPFKFNELNIYLRHIYSLQDYSSQTQFEFDKSVLDSLVIFGSLSGTSGRANTEFKMINDWQTAAGIRWGI